MATLVDIQLVPDRILQAVKQRILANRARFQRSQELAAASRGMTRPRVQRQRHNASAEAYRRPEPAAVRQDTITMSGVWAYWSSPTVSGPPNADANQLLLVPPGTKISGTVSQKYTWAQQNLLPDEYKIIQWPAQSWPTLESQSPSEPPTRRWSLYAVYPASNQFAYIRYNPTEIVTVPWGGDPPQTVFSGQSQTIYTDQSRIAYKEILLLPVGRESCIVVTIARQVRMAASFAINRNWTWTGRMVTGRPWTYEKQGYDYGYDVVVTAGLGETNYIKSTPLFENRAFLVTRKKIKEVSVPALLAQRINAIFPDPSIGADNFYLSPRFLWFGDFTAPWDARGEDGPDQTAYMPSYNYNHYFDQSAYTEDTYDQYSSDAYPTPSRRYAAHFGMGNLSRGIHSSYFYATPSIYTWLKGQMDLSHTSDASLIYANLRRDYFMRAPRIFIDPTLGQNASTWDMTDRLAVTNQLPSRADVAMPSAAFNQRLKVKNSEATYIAWDWSNAGYCRQELLALGFSPSDLQP
jgi:hypothetical protein